MTGDVARRLLEGDPSLFRGTTARHALGWLSHAERYLGPWLDEVDDRRPRRHQRTLLLGMGGSSAAARLYAESRPGGDLRIVDTSNPDTIAGIDFSDATVVASSKSGGTVETQCLLAHALSHGLEPDDLVVITDPGTSLGELAISLGATLVEGDPDTGGRFSGLSPFGLVPALYAGWSADELRDTLASGALRPELTAAAYEEATRRAHGIVDGWAFFDVARDPITSGGSLWLEQLVAETTGKSGRGFVPRPVPDGARVTPGAMQHFHLVAALLARAIDVDPFDQPDVEIAKRGAFAQLASEAPNPPPESDAATLREALTSSRYNVIQAFAPLEAALDLARLRERVERRYGATTANFGPRYLHSTGQLHKGGPSGVAALQVLVRPRSVPERIMGRGYSFHDLHRAQADADLHAMHERGRFAAQLEVDELEELDRLLDLAP